MTSKGPSALTADYLARSIQLNEGHRDGSYVSLARFQAHPLLPNMDGKLSIHVAEHWRCAETTLVLTLADALRLRDWLNEKYPRRTDDL